MKTSGETLTVNFTLIRSNSSLSFEFACIPGISVITGSSGTGKTSLLDCIAGLVSPTTGFIKFGGKTFFDSTNSINLPPQERHIGYVLQRPSLFPHMTIRDNIRYAFPRDMRKNIVSDKIYSQAEEFAIGALLDRKPNQISGGQAQRVALVRAIVAEPLLFLFDEPLSSLDEQSRFDMIAAIKKVKEVTRKSILYVTHSSSEANELADYRILGKDGRFGEA